MSKIVITILFLLPILACGLLFATVLRRAGRSAPRLRSAVLTVGLATLGLSLADWLMLALLPVLHLSYGTTAPPAFMLNAARFGLLLITLPALFLKLNDRDRKAAAAIACILQGALLAVAVYGMYIEPFQLGVTKVELPQATSFLPDRPLRILHLTDIHVEHLSPRERDMLAKVEALQPDLIVMTGDYINPSYMGNTETFAEARQVFSQLHAPYGVYAVNVTEADAPHLAHLFDGLDNIRVLDDEILPVSLPGGTLTLVGVTYSNNHMRDVRALQGLAASLPSTYSLLLYHSPDLIETASASGIDLYLAGHTHGGQIRLPFYGAVITFSMYGKEYEMGEYQVGPTTLYVSRGIGMEGGWVTPRVRFLCPPEMVFLELGK